MTCDLSYINDIIKNNILVANTYLNAKKDYIYIGATNVACTAGCRLVEKHTEKNGGNSGKEGASGMPGVFEVALYVAACLGSFGLGAVIGTISQKYFGERKGNPEQSNLELCRWNSFLFDHDVDLYLLLKIRGTLRNISVRVGLLQKKLLS